MIVSWCICKALAVISAATRATEQLDERLVTPSPVDHAKVEVRALEIGLLHSGCRIRSGQELIRIVDANRGTFRGEEDVRTPKIGARLRQLRRQRGLSQGDIQKRTGLLRCYISRVENGHTIPSLETLERFIGALEIPFYQFFYFDEDPTPHLTSRASLEELAEEGTVPGPEAHFLSKLRGFISQIAERDREVFLAFANRLAVHEQKNA